MYKEVSREFGGVAGVKLNLKVKRLSYTFL